jgi:hypothetical protein
MEQRRLRNFPSHVEHGRVAHEYGEKDPACRGMVWQPANAGREGASDPVKDSDQRCRTLDFMVAGGG